MNEELKEGIFKKMKAIYDMVESGVWWDKEVEHENIDALLLELANEFDPRVAEMAKHVLSKCWYA